MAFVYQAVIFSKYPVKYKPNEIIIQKTITTLNTNHAVEDWVSLVSDDSATSESFFDVDEEKEMGKDASLVLSSSFAAL